MAGRKDAIRRMNEFKRHIKMADPVQLESKLSIVDECLKILNEEIPMMK